MCWQYILRPFLMINDLSDVYDAWSYLLTVQNLFRCCEIYGWNHKWLIFQMVFGKLWYIKKLHPASVVLWYDYIAYYVPTYLQDLVLILETMRIIAITLSPITPSLSLRIYTQLGFTEDQFRVLRWVCSCIIDMLYDSVLIYICSSSKIQSGIIRKCSLQSYMDQPQYFPEHVIIFSYVIRRIRNGEALKQAR